ncbi:MAG: lipase [Faecalibacterium sp.]|nr:lipase [Faecalibacterium sp.]
MSNYKEFRRRSIKRRLRKRILRTMLVVLLAGVVLAGGWFGIKQLGLLPQGGASSSSSPVSSDPVGSSQAVPTPVPTMPPPQNDLAAANTTDADWNRMDYAVRTLNTTVQGQDDGTTAMDYRLAGQPSGTGITELSYFDGVTFLGDSLTQGLQIYTTGLPNAKYCAYKGAGPQTVVNNTMAKRTDGRQEIPLEALVASAPNQIYILFGTNVLVRNTSYDGFLAYYSQMIDMIQQALPGIPIYVQSITPVRPELKRTSPGLNKERLQRINDELAALALSKGCYFVNIWEALADENGDLKAEIAQSDGYHIKPDGYTLWIEYLRTHTEYIRNVAYVPGTSYYVEQ